MAGSTDLGDSTMTETDRSIAAPTLRVEPIIHSVLGLMPTAVFFLDSAWKVEYANDAATRLLPPLDDGGLGSTFWALFPSLEGSELGRSLLRSAELTATTTVRSRVDAWDGWFEVSGYPTEAGIVVFIRDVTEDEERKRHLDATVEQLQTKADLIDLARDAIFVRELDHTITFWNHGAERLYGWTEAEALGRSVRDLLYLDPSEFDRANDSLLESGSWAGELEQTGRDGRRMIMDCRWRIGHGRDGTPFVLCALTDVTDDRVAEEGRYRAQRLESLGSLAGGIAHDLNNVLTPILISSQLLLETEPDETRKMLLASVAESAERGAEMIRQVLTFARGEETGRTLLDMSGLIAQLQAFCRDTMPKSIRVKTTAPSNLRPVNGDGTQVLQVLMNLVTNARDAMPAGGTLTITARNADDLISSDSTVGTTLETASRHVVIDVQDTGTGMDPVTMKKVFEPFFSTKTPEQGTGLGLSTALAIARGHGGSMEVYSELGRGSRFSFRLPAALDGEVAHPTVAPPLDAARGTGQRVLVVDDESTIRTIVQQALEGHGYTTYAAGNGLEAVEVLEANDAAVDLVYTDMMMPVMDGAAIAAYLAEFHPTIPLIVASGLTSNDEIARAANHGVWGFLEKPFSRAELLDAVAGALAAGPVSRPSGGDGVESGFDPMGSI